MEYGFDSWIGKIPWRRKWQPTPVFLPGESHGQRSLAGYSPQGYTESNTTEATMSSSKHKVERDGVRRENLGDSIGVPGNTQNGRKTCKSYI